MKTNELYFNVILKHLKGEKLTPEEITIFSSMCTEEVLFFMKSAMMSIHSSEPSKLHNFIENEALVEREKNRFTK